MVNLQKKQQYTKKTLFDSQVKWTNFSGELVKHCKELFYCLDYANIKQVPVG